MNKGLAHILCFALFALFAEYAFSQPGSTIDLDKDKPKKYEKRRLASERTGEKKFGFGRRLYQNTVTHYNYFFNANNKLNEVVDNAKFAFRDDYTQPLIPFYNYSPDFISQNKSELDSVIYHCTAGVLLHDLRNNWVDNLYLLLGKAYFYRADYDSALAAFRYINYAFAPKDDGYDIPIGSNESNNDGQFSIATKEKTGFGVHKPSRNETFLWMSRTLIDSGELSEAGGLIQILKADPNFPKRLKTSLEELTAYWFYNEKLYDSSALHLISALENADGKQEKSRWEFLIAQLFELTHKTEGASYWYGKAAGHATDPILEVYANLNGVKLSNGNDPKAVQEKIDNLLKLARRDKYARYRDIIYYVAAQAELERNNYTEAMKDLEKSVKFSTDNIQQKSMSFLLAADVSYDTKRYDLSYALYDSIDVNSLKTEEEKARVDERKPALKVIHDNQVIINREDSLQKVAALPAAQRDDLIKKMVKQLRKEKGVKEEGSNENVNAAVKQEGSADLFAAKTQDDWYFDNAGRKSSGFNEFRQKWGDRPNGDNWRRKADLNKVTSLQTQDALPDGLPAADSTTTALMSLTDITYDALLAFLPLKEDQVKASNGKISKSMFTIGKTFQEQLEEYQEAIDNYEKTNQRFNIYDDKQEALFNLYYCYTKLGRTYSADSAKTALNKEFKDGKWIKSLNQPQEAVVKESSDKNPATKKYEEIYNLFIEGNFDKAEQEKKLADSLYDKSYWTPQLLYIEGIYHVSKKEDSVAIERLQYLAVTYPSSPLMEKANTMIDVLKRRTEIENYLTNLQIKRYEEDASTVVNLQESKVVTQAPLKRDSVVSKAAVEKPVAIKMDTATKAPVVLPKQFAFNPAEPQYILMVFDKVAPVFVNEAKNAFVRFNRQTYYNQKIDASLVKLDDRYNLLLMGPFTDAVGALDYVNKTKPLTQGRIMPWLTPEKYSYAIISQGNLDLLKDNKDVEGYRKILQQAIPGKF